MAANKIVNTVADFAAFPFYLVIAIGAVVYWIVRALIDSRKEQQR